MTVKDERGPKQDADSHIGNSVERRDPRRRLNDHHDTRDDRHSDSILDFVEALSRQSKVRLARCQRCGAEAITGWNRLLPPPLVVEEDIDGLAA